jgi:hypothetical protein
MKTLKRLSLGMLFPIYLCLLANCQKEESHLVSYHLETQKADLQFRLTEDEDYRIVTDRFDTSFLVFKVKDYKKCMQLHYHYKFRKEIMGRVKVQILLDGVVCDEEDVSCDKCVGKTSSLKVCI